MDEERIPREFTQSLRGMQLVIGALVMSMVMFGVITLVMSGGAQPNNQPVVAYVGLAFAAAVLVAREIVPKVMLDSARTRIANSTW